MEKENMLCSVRYMAGIEELNSEFMFSKTANKLTRMIKDKGVTHMRKIRGDGNCYYRAVGFLYVQEIVLKGAEYIKCLIMDLNKAKIYKRVRREEHVLGPLIKGLNEILEKVVSKSVEEGLKYYTAKMRNNSEFDRSVYMLCRLLVARFAAKYKEEKFNGLKMSDIVKQEHASIQEYVASEVEPGGVDAKLLTLMILPVALRHPISIVFADYSKEADELSIVDYQAVSGDLKIVQNNLLDLHEERPIWVLLKPGHYDALYSLENLNKNPLLLSYDPPPVECLKCGGWDANAKLPCGHDFHSECLVGLVASQTEGRIFLLPGEEEKIKRSCPKCDSPISDQEAERIVGREATTVAQNWMKARASVFDAEREKKKPIVIFEDDNKNEEDKEIKPDEDIIFPCCKAKAVRSIILDMYGQKIIQLDSKKNKVVGRECSHCMKAYSVEACILLLGKGKLKESMQKMCNACGKDKPEKAANCHMHKKCSACDNPRNCAFCEYETVINGVKTWECACCLKAAQLKDTVSLECCHRVCSSCKNKPEINCTLCKTNKVLFPVCCCPRFEFDEIVTDGFQHPTNPAVKLFGITCNICGLFIGYERLTSEDLQKNGPNILEQFIRDGIDKKVQYRYFIRKS